jgi:hypothetical protein
VDSEVLCPRNNSRDCLAVASDPPKGLPKQRRKESRARGIEAKTSSSQTKTFFLFHPMRFALCPMQFLEGLSDVRYLWYL